MKLISIAAACCAAALMSGCQSGLTDDLHAALGPRESPRTRVYQADQRATYEAAKAVIEQMGYRFVRGGPAQGEIEALSAISGGDERGSARQISMRIKLRPGPESGTEMELSLTEILEGDSVNQRAMATQTPLIDTPLYRDFFRNVQTALNGPR